MSNRILTDTCPECDGADALAVWREDNGALRYECTAGCDAKVVTEHMAVTVARSDQANAAQATRQGARVQVTVALGGDDPGAALAQLLGLDKLTPPLTLTEAAIIGEGADAPAYMTLSNGAELRFRALRDMAQPARLAAEVVASTGAMPKLNGPTAMACVALLRRYATHLRTMSEVDEAVEWGVTFLQTSPFYAVDLYDQGERWAAFSRLASVHPEQVHAETRQSVASASLVLRHRDGSRLVRCSWFRAHVHDLEPRVSSALLATLMQRAGWVRRNSQGRWKATRPNFRAEQLNWAFWLVPAGWEDRGDEHGDNSTSTQQWEA